MKEVATLEVTPQEQSVFDGLKQQLQLGDDSHPRQWGKIPQIGMLCYKDVYGWLNGNQDMTDHSGNAYAAHVARDAVRRIYVLDSQIVGFGLRNDPMEHFRQFDSNILKWLLVEDYLIAFPVCGEGHWWVVFAKYNSLDCTVTLSACNSHRGYEPDVKNSLHKIARLINLWNGNSRFLQEHNDSSYDFGITCEVMNTLHQRESLGCGAHTCAHIHLAARNMLYTHTIDEVFIAKLRVKAVSYLNIFRGVMEQKLIRLLVLAGYLHKITTVLQ